MCPKLLRIYGILFVDEEQGEMALHTAQQLLTWLPESHWLKAQPGPLQSTGIHQVFDQMPCWVVILH